MAAEQMTLLVWESEVSTDGDNRAVVTARRPVFAMDAKQAAKVLTLKNFDSWEIMDPK
jgi:hypothetical protein